MNPTPYNPSTSKTGEETLRLLAKLASPAGLEDRVRGALRSAPPAGRVLAWPMGARPQSGWVRAAAAAAIVFVVAGGGWGVYMRVQQNQPARVVVMPVRPGAPGGLSGAGAIRTPQTLPGPVVTQPAQTAKEQSKPVKKPMAKHAPNRITSQQAAPDAAPEAQP